MKDVLRQTLIAAALAATVAAAFLLERREQGVQLARPTAPVPTRAAAPAAGTAGSPASLRLSPEGEDIFPAHSWRPAPPPMPIEAAAPVAPPLPFVFKGRMEDGGQTRVFLARQEAILVVKQGDTLDGAYRVDAITPGGVEFTYLPLKLKQSLNFAK